MKNARWLFLILGALSGCFAFGLAQADVGNVYQNGTITATGATQWVTLNGQGSCVVVLGGTFTGVTVVPQTSGDGGVTQQTALAIGSGSLSSAGTYWGPIVSASNGVSLFRLNVTGYSTGTANYYITCTPAGGTQTITGSVSISGTVNTNITGPTCANTLPCVQVSSLPGPAATDGSGNIKVNVAAATTIPASIASPVGAHGGVQIEGVASGTTVPVTGSVVVSSITSWSGAGGLPAGNNTIGAVTAYQNSSGNVIATLCDNVASAAISSATTTALVAASGSSKVYICGATAALTGTTTTATLTFKYGTTTTTPCDTGANTIGGLTSLGTGTAATPELTLLPLQAIAYIVTPASQAVCVTSIGTQAQTVKLYYAQHA